MGLLSRVLTRLRFRAEPDNTRMAEAIQRQRATMRKLRMIDKEIDAMYRHD